MTPARVLVVGWRGAVGRELIGLLSERGLSARVIPVGRVEAPGVLALDRVTFAPGDLVFLCAGAAVSRHAAPRAVAEGARVVDLSSAFRQDADVPLVVPEVNGATLARAASLVASPNCTATLLCVALAPLARAFGLRRVVVATYQAVSGAGARGIAELHRQTRAALDHEPLEPSVFPEPIAFNLFSHESAMDVRTGQNGEEHKVVRESRRLLGLDGLELSVTCVRVPVERVHTCVVDVQLERPAPETDIRRVLESAPGLTVVDDRAAGRFPTPLRASGRDDVLIGRIRSADASAGETDAPWRALAFLACGDQLRKGAASNALAIMDAWA